MAQGYDLGMGGNMYVDVTGDSVHVGGYAVSYGRKIIDLATK